MWFSGSCSPHCQWSICFTELCCSPGIGFLFIKATSTIILIWNLLIRFSSSSVISVVLNSIHWCPSDALSYPGRARRTNKLCVLVSTCWGTRELFPWCSMNILSILYYGEIIQTKKDKQTLCPRLKLLRNTRTCTFFSVAVWTNQEKKLCVLVSRCWKWAFCSCSWKGWFYAVLRFSGSTCCIRTLHIDKSSTLL